MSIITEFTSISKNKSFESKMWSFIIANLRHLQSYNNGIQKDDDVKNLLVVRILAIKGILLLIKCCTKWKKIRYQNLER